MCHGAYAQAFGVNSHFWTIGMSCLRLQHFEALVKLARACFDVQQHIHFRFSSVSANHIFQNLPDFSL